MTRKSVFTFGKEMHTQKPQPLDDAVNLFPISWLVNGTGEVTIGEASGARLSIMYVDLYVYGSTTSCARAPSENFALR